MKKQKKRQGSGSNIQEVATLYKLHAGKASEETKAAKDYKEQLLEYAESNPDQFKGNELFFDCGLRIERRESNRPSYDGQDISLQWLDKAIDAGLGGAVSVVIDHKKLPAILNKKQLRLLEIINYEVEAVETLAVCLK